MRDIINFDFIRIILIRALIFIALFSLLPFNLIFSTPQILSDIENNCLWVEHKSISDSSKVDSLISFIENNKINKIFLETFTDGQFKYNLFDTSSNNDSTYLFNNFEYFTKKISSSKINLYAWVNAYKIWDKNFYPDDLNHFYYECPDCLEADLNSRSDKLIKLDKVQSLEWEGIFLSPLHPKVNEYLIEIFDSIINLYVFDGIIIDYLRYQNYYYGYNMVGLQNFENRYEFNPLDLNRGIISERFGYTPIEIDSLNLLWDNYRRDGITELLFDLNNKIINDSLNFDILASVNISPFDSVNKWYQDWPKWISDNLVDYVIVKNDVVDFYDFNYNNSIIRKIYSSSKHINKIIIGMNLYEINPVNIGNKILYLRLNGFNNISLYPYNEYKNIINWYDPIYKSINFNLKND